MMVRLTRLSLTMPSSNSALLDDVLPSLEASDVDERHWHPPRPLCPHCGRVCRVVRSRRGALFMKRRLGCRACKYVAPGKVVVPLKDCARAKK